MCLNHPYENRRWKKRKRGGKKGIRGKEGNEERIRRRERKRNKSEGEEEIIKMIGKRRETYRKKRGRG